MPDSTNIFEEKPDHDTLGGRFARAREAAGLGIEQLAWQLGVDIACVRAWESDRAQPDTWRLTTIAGLFGVSLSWLLHGVGTSPSEDAAGAAAWADAQLDRLRALHAETGSIIARLEIDLARRRQVDARQLV